MAFARRHFAVRSHWLGVAVTLLVLLIDLAGGLEALEQWSYDRRARHFQHFTPPPNDRLVLLDIDDAALETIGRWPWPRSTQADIIEEIRLAGAEALALDVILSEPSEPPIGRRDQTEVPDEDASLAAALQRFGKVLVPMNFRFDPPAPTSPLASTALALLRDDLEMSQQDVAGRLPTGSPPLTENVFVSVRRRALSERIEQELQRRTGTGPGGPTTLPSTQEVRRRLLPRGGATENTSSLVRQFNAQYARTLGAIEAQRFSREIPSSAPPLLEGTDQIVTLSAFSHVAGCSGYVNFLKIGGVIRVMPLFVKYKGRLYPQMDLALACYLYGIDIRDVQLSENQILLPRPGGSPIVIPIHTVHSPEHGDLGAFVDIPWFGTDNWRTMYDYPAHAATRHHVPVTQAWALADSRRTVARNNAQAITAISFFADAGLDSARAFLQKPPAPEDVGTWLAGAERVLTEAAPLIEQAGNVPPGERGPDEKLVLQHSSALRRVIEEDRRFVGKAAELRTALSGKAVLLGWTGGTGTTDEWPTSLHSACPGVVIHSVVFNAIITGHFWRTAPRWVTALITVVIGLLTTAFVARLSAWRALFTTALLLTTYLLVNALLIFDYGNWIVGVAGPTVAALTVWGTLTLARFVVETRERARITRRFQTYVDPSVVRYVIEHPELARVDGVEREMTVVFTDLAGFTSLAEQLRVKAVKILGRYISRMVPLIRGHRGLIHRFMGDGIMFSYGAPVDNPAHAADAIATILDMQRAMVAFNEELAAEGYRALAMRGGVNTGLAMVGDSGAEDASEYACLGDTTNLAARLESANKMTGTNNLLSARTVEMVDGRFLVRPIGRLQVKGKKQWVMTYEAMCEAESAPEEQKRLAELSRVMVDAYIAGGFAECLSAADSLDAAFGPSKLTSLYREACRQAITAPSSDFQGQIVLQEK